MANQTTRFVLVPSTATFGAKDCPQGILRPVSLSVRSGDVDGASASMAGIAGQAQLPATYGIRVKIFRQGSRSSKTYAFRKFDPNGVKSVTDLSILKKEFESEIGTINSSCAEIGYMRGGTKVSFRGREDLLQVLNNLREGSDLTLWISVTSRQAEDDESHDSDEDSIATKGKEKKRRRLDPNASKDNRIHKLMQQLRDNHGNKYASVQYRLWAEMSDIGSHDSLSEPPNVPMFSGERKTRASHKKESLTVSDIGTAIASVISGANSINHASAVATSALCPSQKAEVRGRYISQMKDLHSLLQLGAISQDEYDSQKKKILGTLDDL